MEDHNYIFDFKNITDIDRLRGLLKDWDVKDLSDRSFIGHGREIRNIDIIGFYQWIGPHGHIFVFDCQTTAEQYHPKSPKGRRRHIAPEDDLNYQTLREIEQILELREGLS